VFKLDPYDLAFVLCACLFNLLIAAMKASERPVTSSP
jgi:hypothetical protein